MAEFLDKNHHTNQLHNMTKNEYRMLAAEFSVHKTPYEVIAFLCNQNNQHAFMIKDGKELIGMGPYPRKMVLLDGSIDAHDSRKPEWQEMIKKSQIYWEPIIGDPNKESQMAGRFTEKIEAGKFETKCEDSALPIQEIIKKTPSLQPRLNGPVMGG